MARSFVLSSKKGKEAWVEPVIENGGYTFQVHSGRIPKKATEGTVVRTGGTCILSQTAMPFTYIRAEGKSGRMSERLMAIVAEGKGGRVYLSPTQQMIDIAEKANPEWKPEHALPVNPRDFKTPNYGMSSFGDLFTPRQLVALTTFSDLVQEARTKAIAEAKAAGMADDGLGIDAGGQGATAYGDALAVYLSFAINKQADRGSTICSWDASRSSTRNTFGRQAIPMTWDFAEPNPLSTSTGNFMSGVDWAINVIKKYDNIGYADLSDFFYVWMRRSLRAIYPDLFSTLAVPKAEELVATPYRHGSKEQAETFFLDGMTQAIQNMATKGHPAFPVSIYYAFKQSETKGDSTSNTGWETFLEALQLFWFAKNAK